MSDNVYYVNFYLYLKSSVSNTAGTRPAPGAAIKTLGTIYYEIFNKQSMLPFWVACPSIRLFYSGNRWKGKAVL